MSRRALYRSESHESEVRRWCADRLRSWQAPHRTTVLDTSLGTTHLTVLGSGPDVCVYLPGTNFNAATSTAVLEALAARSTVVCADLPGQPGLSAAARPREDAAVHERWVREVIDAARAVRTGRVALVGHSRGAAVALAADPSTVDALVLLDPAGLARVNLARSTMVPSLAWLLRPTDRRSARVVQLLAGPADTTDLTWAVVWMTMVARSTRSSGAPGPHPSGVLDRWRGRTVRVLVGRHDVFFPPDRLAGPVRRHLGGHLDVVDGAGHLLPDQRPESVLAVLRELLP